MEKVTKEQFIARLAFLASSVCVYQNQNKPKSLVNIVRNLSCLLESLLGSKMCRTIEPGRGEVSNQQKCCIVNT